MCCITLNTLLQGCITATCPAASWQVMFCPACTAQGLCAVWQTHHTRRSVPVQGLAFNHALSCGTSYAQRRQPCICMSVCRAQGVACQRVAEPSTKD